SRASRRWCRSTMRRGCGPSSCSPRASTVAWISPGRDRPRAQPLSRPPCLQASARVPHRATA
ncbi:MAG: hypothetical protein ACK55I_09840, partial [bacterium]